MLLLVKIPQLGNISIVHLASFSLNTFSDATILDEYNSTNPLTSPIHFAILGFEVLNLKFSMRHSLKIMGSCLIKDDVFILDDEEEHLKHIIRMMRINYILR